MAWVAEPVTSRATPSHLQTPRIEEGAGGKATGGLQHVRKYAQPGSLWQSDIGMGSEGLLHHKVWMKNWEGFGDRQKSCNKG